MSKFLKDLWMRFTTRSKQKLVYISYPYSDDPLKRSEEVKALAQTLAERRPDIIPIIPHFVFDAWWDFPEGYTHPEFGEQELEVIFNCAAITSPPPMSDHKSLGGGVRWENAFARWLQNHGHPIKIIGWNELLRGEKI